MIKTVLIDVDNTLLDFSAGAKNAIIDGFDEYKLDYSPKVYEVFNKINHMLWVKIEDGLLSRDELYRIRWNTIFSELGITNVNGESFERGFRARIAETAIPVDGSIELLSYLHKKYTVIVASNASFSQQFNRLKKAGMTKYIDKIITSELAGFSKPACEFFDYCIKTAELGDKSRIILIGDSINADIIGGQNYGLKTCWFNFYNAECPDNVKPDYTVNKLIEIKNIL